MKKSQAWRGLASGKPVGAIGELWTGAGWWCVWQCFLALMLLLPQQRGQAEDADRLRGYLHFRNGEFDTAWDVHDYWGLSLGLNFDRHWGVELAGDVFEQYLSYGELSVNSMMPQARFRWPFFQDRLVPYVVLGGGPVFMQFNDPRGSGRGQKIEGEGWRAGLGAGLGLEYFLTDSVAFVTEGKYLWIDQFAITVAGKEESYNASTWLASFGLRVYFDENRPRPLAELEEEVPTRFCFGVRYGGGVLVDSELGNGLALRSEASAYGSLNQSFGMLVGANFGANWGADLHLSLLEPELALHSAEVAEYSTFSVLPMGRFRLPLGDGRWVPYLTGGIGAVYGELNDGAEHMRLSGKGFYPAVAIGTGVEYFIHRNMSVTADVWWQYTWGHEFKVGSANYSGNFSSVQLQLGFRTYLFETGRKHAGRPGGG